MILAFLGCPECIRNPHKSDLFYTSFARYLVYGTHPVTCWHDNIKREHLYAF